jgi:uncharacterized damage-inducible protein DinB
MKDAIRTLMIRELETFVREIELFPDDQVLWKTVPGVTNSAGNLAVHVAGNLEHFVGAILGGTGYVRNRPLEFSRKDGTRAEVVALLKSARNTVEKVLNGLPEARLQETFPELIQNHEVRTDLFLTHLSVHLAFHLGQAGYLRRVLTGDPTSATPVSTAALAATGAIPAN